MRKKRRKSKFIEVLLYIVLIFLFGLLVYNYYQILVDQGKAESIESLKMGVSKIE